MVTCSRPGPIPLRTAVRFAITLRVWASIPSGSTHGTRGAVGHLAGEETQPSHSTAWLKGATGFGSSLGRVKEHFGIGYVALRVVGLAKSKHLLCHSAESRPSWPS